MEELIETLTFLEFLEASIVPVTFEASERCTTDKRLEGYKKGLKAEVVYKVADTVYECVELLLSVHNPILVKKLPLNEKGEKCTSFQSTMTMQLQNRSTPSDKFTSTSFLSNHMS